MFFELCEHCYFTWIKDNSCMWVSEVLHLSLCMQMCCYNKFGSLISEEDGSGGSLLLFHPSQFPHMYTAMDVNPKTWCCDYSDNCDTFYLVRPMDKCDSYGAPILGGSRKADAYKDLHFKSDWLVLKKKYICTQTLHVGSVHVSYRVCEWEFSIIMIVYYHNYWSGWTSTTLLFTPFKHYCFIIP